MGQQQETTDEPITAMTAEEIEAFANGELDIDGAPDGEQETQVENNPESQEPETEQANADEGGGEQNEPAQEEEKPRSKMIPRDRFDEVNEKRNEAERRAQELEYKLNQQTEAMDKLLRKLSGEPEKEQEEENEVLDDVLKKQVDSKFSQIEERDFQRTVNQEAQLARQHAPDFDNAYNYLLAAGAYDIINSYQAVGKSIGEQEAIGLAQEAVEKEMRYLYTNNAQPGAMAQRLYNAALARGYTPEQAEKASNKAGNGVNMKAVDKARREAGAPAIEKESVQMEPTGEIDNIYKDAVEAGFSKEYLRKLGL